MKQVDKCDSILSIVCGAHPPTASTQMNGNNKNQPPALPLSIRKKIWNDGPFFSLMFVHSGCLASQPMVSANTEKCHPVSLFLYPIYIFKILSVSVNISLRQRSLLASAILDVSRAGNFSSSSISLVPFF